MLENRIVIMGLPILLLLALPGGLNAFQNGQCADFAIGQPYSATNTANLDGVSASGANGAERVWTDGKRLMVLEPANHRLKIFNTLPQSNGATADLAVGQPSLSSGVANSGGLSERGLQYPSGFFCDGIRLFVADTQNHRVLIYFSLPYSHFAPANLVLGQADFRSSAPNRGGDPDSNTLNRPMDVFFDGKKLYVADQENSRVLIWNSLPAFNGQSADVVVGQPNMSFGTANDAGPKGPLSLSNPTKLSGRSLYWPHALAVHQGRLYIADTGNNRVLIYNRPPSSNYSHADLVLGQESFLSGGAGGGPKGYNNPRGLSLQGERMVVADYWNHRFLVYHSLPQTHTAAADVVIGQPNFNASAANQAGPIGPCGIDRAAGAAIFNNRLYACDSYNNRVLVFEDPITPTPSPTPARPKLP